MLGDKVITILSPGAMRQNDMILDIDQITYLLCLLRSKLDIECEVPRDR